VGVHPAFEDGLWRWTVFFGLGLWTGVEGSEDLARAVGEARLAELRVADEAGEGGLVSAERVVLKEIAELCGEGGGWSKLTAGGLASAVRAMAGVALEAPAAPASEDLPSVRAGQTGRERELLECLDFVTDALNEALLFEWAESGIGRSQLDVARENAAEAVERGRALTDPLGDAALRAAAASSQPVRGWLTGYEAGEVEALQEIVCRFEDAIHGTQ
jgi:hypothetical protein